MNSLCWHGVSSVHFQNGGVSDSPPVVDYDKQEFDYNIATLRIESSPKTAYSCQCRELSCDYCTFMCSQRLRHVILAIRDCLELFC